MHPMEIRTPRLLLNGFSHADAHHVAALAGAYEISRFTLNIPYPYELSSAQQWIASHDTMYTQKSGIVFAVRSPTTMSLIGCVGLNADNCHHRGELGYWIGTEFWNKGYCTEAATAAAQFAFDYFSLNKITSRHLDSNNASGRVMEKLGMKKEGILKHEIYKEGTYHDLHVYGLLKDNLEVLSL